MAGALLPPVAAWLGEHTVEHELLGIVNVEWALTRLGIDHRDRPQTEAVHEPIGECRCRRRERQGVLHEHEVTRALRTRKRIDIGDVRNRIGQCARAGDVV
jgi:hypothetical protein